MAIDQVTWLILRVVTGFCLAGLFTITESWINASSANSVRGRVLSAYMTVNYLSYGASQSLLTVLDPSGFQIFSMVAILVALSLVPLALSRTQTPASIGTARLGVMEIVRISPLGVAGCVGAGLINGAFGTLGPVYVQSLGGSVEDVGLFMMVAIFSGFLMQFPMGRLSDRFAGSVCSTPGGWSPRAPPTSSSGWSPAATCGSSSTIPHRSTRPPAPWASRRRTPVRCSSTSPATAASGN
jgi:hypothetical protein